MTPTTSVAVIWTLFEVEALLTAAQRIVPSRIRRAGRYSSTSRDTTLNLAVVAGGVGRRTDCPARQKCGQAA